MLRSCGGPPELNEAANPIRAHGPNDEPPRRCVHVWSAPDADAEAELVGRLVARAVSDGEDLSEIAVLYRKHKMVGWV